MHLANGIDVIDYQFVAIRYKSMLWRSYDFVMVFLAMLHGLNGARIIVDDYIQKEPIRKIILLFLFFAGGIFVLMGFWVIIFFPSIGM
jgi:succinate dehydrogenase / fumarate reductase membrane anchor subunit